MALLAYFRLIEETDSHVEYAFGPSTDAMNRRLVIDKQTGQATPTDGPPDLQYLNTAGKILHLQRRQGTWPLSGLLAA